MKNWEHLHNYSQWCSPPKKITTSLLEDSTSALRVLHQHYLLWNQENCSCLSPISCADNWSSTIAVLQCWTLWLAHHAPKVHFSPVPSECTTTYKSFYLKGHRDLKEQDIKKIENFFSWFFGLFWGITIDRTWVTLDMDTHWSITTSFDRWIAHCVSSQC